MSDDRLTMPIGEAMFGQRSVRKFKPDAIPAEDIRLILEAAVKAPNGANAQVGRFLVVTDRDKIREFGKLYHEAWWAKRWDDHRWSKPEDIPPEEKSYRSAMGLADDIKDAPCVMFAFTLGQGGASSVMPACQNLMLAAHALGIGSIPTTLHPKVNGPLQRDVRHSQGRDVSLLHPDGLPVGEVRAEPSQAGRRDHPLEPLDEPGAVGMTGKPAVSLAAMPGRRKATVEMAQRFEREGWSG